jgi:hypothetical protein
MFSSPVNPFAPGWRSLCNRSADCEDITNHNVLKVSKCHRQGKALGTYRAFGKYPILLTAVQGHLHLHREFKASLGYMKT